MTYDDPKPTNWHMQFDTTMGIIMSSLEVKYPTKLETTKEAMLRVCRLCYEGIRREADRHNPNNENKAVRLDVGLLRKRYTAWRKKIAALECKV